MVDYDRLSATALRLLSANGRAITFIKFNQTPIDVTKPWNGPATGGEVELELNGVFMSPNSLRQFGLPALSRGTEFVDLVTHSEQIIVVNPQSVDINEYTEVRDGSERWGILGTQILRPGPTTVLAYVGVRR